MDAGRTMLWVALRHVYLPAGGATREGMEEYLRVLSSMQGRLPEGHARLELTHVAD